MQMQILDFSFKVFVVYFLFFLASYFIKYDDDDDDYWPDPVEDNSVTLLYLVSMFFVNKMICSFHCEQEQEELIAAK